MKPSLGGIKLKNEAKIDLRVGGRYEMYFLPDASPGSRGSEGCVVYEIDAPTRLVFSWNFPPTIPALRKTGAQTQVIVTLQLSEEKTTVVSLAQTGWQDGTAWDQGYAYFDRVWTVVLNRLKRRFDTGPIDWRDPGQ